MRMLSVQLKKKQAVFKYDMSRKQIEEQVGATIDQKQAEQKIS